MFSATQTGEVLDLVRAGMRNAVRVQVRDGQAQVLDGPFAEAKEMVGGFFLIDCPTRAEAVAIARHFRTTRQNCHRPDMTDSLTDRD